MVHSPQGQNRPVVHRRRLAIDVYFVLYLTAIVLLLGTAPLAHDAYQIDLEEAIIKLVDTEFSIEVERIGMYIPVDASGPTPASSSTSDFIGGDTVNDIRAIGSFESVRFRILDVVDTLSGSPVDTENALLIRSSDSTARFVWSERRERRPARFLVRIEGVAIPKIPASVDDPELRGHIRTILEERNLLRDTAEFFVNVVSLQQIVAELEAQPAPTISTGSDTGSQPLSAEEIISRFLQRTAFNTGSFSAVVAQANLYAAPDGTWSQRIGIAGIAPEELSVASPSNVVIGGRGADWIEVSGRAPTSGSQPVRLTLRSRNQESTTVEFEVRSVSVDRPAIPSTFFANTGYSVDLRSPQIDARRVRVSIVENGVTRDQGRDPQFRYVPTVSSGNGSFERYVDGKLFDSYSFQISSIPDPELTLLRDAGDSVIVESISWGEYSGKQNRSIVRVERGQGVGTPTRLSEEVDPLTFRIRSTWSVRRIGRDGGEFVLMAHDMRGFEHKDRLPIAGRN